MKTTNKTNRARLGKPAMPKEIRRLRIVGRLALAAAFALWTGLMGTARANTISDGTSSVTISGVTLTDTATSGDSLTAGDSAPFTVVAGAPAKLAFGVQPSDKNLGFAISPAVTVLVQDANGNLVANDTSSVTIGGTTFAGDSTLTTNAVAGVATFDNLKPTTEGTGITLTASDGSLTEATSSTFKVFVATDNTGVGGTITYTDSSGLNPRSSPAYAGGYVVHTFTNSGTLNIPTAVSASVLVVGGGGGGGGNTYGAGGGAGGLVYYGLATPTLGASCAIPSGKTIVVVGSGGAAGTSQWVQGSNGQNSSLGTLVAWGGGGGSSNDGDPGSSGGSGGGSYGGTVGLGLQPGSISGGYGNAGGLGSGGAGGGGGGAGAVGGGGAGAGGNGLNYGISGVTTGYSGGGDGAGNNEVALGGGGISGNTAGLNNGAANTGGGGAGAWNPVFAGIGGSGIVIVRYPYTSLLPKGTRIRFF